MTDSSERLKIRNDKPDSWIAVEEGDNIVGILADVTEAWSDQRRNAAGGNGDWYPLLTMTVESATGYPDTARELKVHCFGSVLYNEVERHRPEIGERLVITYRGEGEAKPGRNAPILYTLRVEGRKDQAQRAYGRMFGAGPSTVPARPGARPGEPAPAPDEPTQTTLDEQDSDIPF